MLCYITMIVPNTQLSINDTLVYVKQNTAPLLAQTFKEGFLKNSENSHGSQTITAHRLGDINLNEEITDTTRFMRQLYMAMFPNYLYPPDFLETGVGHHLPS